MKEIIEGTLKEYLEKRVEEERRILAYLEKREGYEPENLHFTADIPKAEFLSLARAIAQTLYIRNEMRSTLTCEGDTDGDAAFLIEKEINEGALYITLNDLCLRCYGSKRKRVRARMSAFIEKLGSTFIAGKVVMGKKRSISSKRSFCKDIGILTINEDNAVLYKFRIEPTIIMLCCLTDSLWQDSRNSDAAAK